MIIIIIYISNIYILHNQKHILLKTHWHKHLQYPSPIHHLSINNTHTHIITHILLICIPIYISIYYNYIRTQTTNVCSDIPCAKAWRDQALGINRESLETWPASRSKPTHTYIFHIQLFSRSNPLNRILLWIFKVPTYI